MAGPDHLSHPVNKKAKCWVYLRDLQEECGLTDAALQHIALICGPRCFSSSLPVCSRGGASFRLPTEHARQLADFRATSCNFLNIARLQRRTAALSITHCHQIWQGSKQSGLRGHSSLDLSEYLNALPTVQET